MNIGDRVRIRKTGIVGKVTDVITNSGRHYLVRFAAYGIPVVCLEGDIEPLPVTNPCVCCGEETPEGRQVCWQCENENRTT